MASLTFKEIKARPVVCKLTRPAVARIGAMTHLPIILIDLFTEEGVVGRSYLKPYLPKAMKYLLPALLDFGEMLKGRGVSPVDLYETARKSPHFVGYQGLSMIAVAGLDMAAWDALAKAADIPLCVLLGGSVGPVNAYNSNGLWLKSPDPRQPRRSNCSTRGAEGSEPSSFGWAARRTLNENGHSRLPDPHSRFSDLLPKESSASRKSQIASLMSSG